MECTRDETQSARRGGCCCFCCEIDDVAAATLPLSAQRSVARRRGDDSFVVLVTLVHLFRVTALTFGPSSSGRAVPIDCTAHVLSTCIALQYSLRLPAPLPPPPLIFYPYLSHHVASVSDNLCLLVLRGLLRAPPSSSVTLYSSSLLPLNVALYLISTSETFDHSHSLCSYPR